MDILQRAKNICLTPATEWSQIASESTSAGTLLTSYVAPLAAIGAAAGLVGGSIVGQTVPFIGAYRTPIATGAFVAVFGFVMTIVAVLIVSMIINALAPNFGGEKNGTQALKVAVYSYTPAWIAGVLRIVPNLGLLVFLAALYGLYLLYVGLPKLMRCPKEKAMSYTAVVVVCAIVISVVVSASAGIVGASIIGPGVLAGRALGGRTPGVATEPPGGQVQIDPNSPLGKLQALGNKLDESNKKMESAQKSGDQNAQMAAAMEGLGTILGGGKRVEPVAIEELKPFVPETFAGMQKKSSNAERNGFAGLMVSKAEATYSDGADRHVTLEISDSGGVSGLLGLAGWVDTEGEKDSDDTYERTAKLNGRLVHEERSKRGGTNEYALVLGDRFIVTARGQGVDLDGLKGAVGDLALSKLESMKDVGVQK